jgi:endonuclease YncB( thermonuclease family)
VATFQLLLIAGLLVVIGIVAYSKYLPARYTPRPLTKAPVVIRPPVEPQMLSGRASVIDGDTIEIHGTRIRLFGIDAPESGQSCTVQGKAYRCGQQAAFTLSNKIGTQAVECQPKDQDRYGRIVAVCRVEGEDINAWMVARGWALAYRYYSSDYVRQEQDASSSKIGVWQGDFEPPWDWRHRHPHRRNSRSEATSFRPPPREPLHAMYYRPGEFRGTRYRTIEECSQARQRAGNVGVCVLK